MIEVKYSIVYDKLLPEIIMEVIENNEVVLSQIINIVLQFDKLDQKIIDQYRSAIIESYNQTVNQLAGSIDNLLLISESSNALRQLSLKNKTLNDITQNRNTENV